MGIATVPLKSLMIAIPAVITTKTTARATDSADVYLNESAGNDKICFNKMQLNRKYIEGYFSQHANMYTYPNA